MTRYLLGLWLLSVLLGCGEQQTPAPEPTTEAPSSATAVPDQLTIVESNEQQFPDIIDVELTPNGDNTYNIAVTISSPYDSPQRYADGWRVLDPNGNVLAEHTLLHDHANEQPFTRVQRNVAIPADMPHILLEGRDTQYGYGGEIIKVPVN